MRKLFNILVALLILLMIPLGSAGAENIDDTYTASEYAPLKKDLQQTIAGEKGTFGVYLIDLQSAKTMGINPLEPFHAASTFKLPLNIYLVNNITAGQVDPNLNLVYRTEHYEGGTGRLQKDPVGSSYSIETLAKYSIIYSDNVATNMLIAYLGKPNVKDYMRSIGGLVVDDQKNITCPKDMAEYMNYLLALSGENQEYNRLLDYLGHTIYNDRIPKLLPKNIKIAHKIGNWPPTSTYNDVGYVEHPINPYIIAIYSKNTGDVDAAFQVIQQISRVVYDYQTGLVMIKLLVNGQPVQTEVPVVLKNNAVLIPLRDLAEVLAVKVQWNASMKEVVLSKPDQEVKFTVGELNAQLNNSRTTLTAPAELIDNRVMVPLRTLSEIMGATVAWDSNTHTASVNTIAKHTPDNLAPVPEDPSPLNSLKETSRTLQTLIAQKIMLLTAKF